jgi:NAD(P)-dependent dehydrogenase (short-subunit alcohol dehydrogenase family)
MNSGQTTGALAGKIAVVTGSTSGSGRAVARRFAAEGAHVVLLARGRERLIAEAELMEGAIPIVTDVGDADSVRQAFAEIEERFGKVDILVNNAGIYRPCRVEDLSDFDIERQVRTNYLGPVYTCRAAIPLLRAAGQGDIVNTSSESTLDPFPMLSMYVSSKAALEAFSRTLMTEVQDHDIRVTVVVQGVATEHATTAGQLWTERGYIARVLGREAGPGQSVDDIADVHLYVVTRPRGQRLDTIHVRSY